MLNAICYMLVLLSAGACLAAPPAVRVLYYVHNSGGDPASVDFINNVSLEDNGQGALISMWAVPGVPRPDDLASLDDGPVVEAWYTEFKDAQLQAGKPVERKQGENLFFQLVQAVLTDLNDPRKDAPVIPKLTFQELTDLLDIMAATDMPRATLYSLRLLSVDALLKRFSATWWDTAQIHEI